MDIVKQFVIGQQEDIRYIEYWVCDERGNQKKSIGMMYQSVKRSDVCFWEGELPGKGFRLMGLVGGEAVVDMRSGKRGYNPPISRWKDENEI